MKKRVKKGRGDKAIKARALASRDRLLSQILHRTMIICVPRISKKFFFYNHVTDDMYNLLQESIDLVNNNSYNWCISGYAICKSKEENKKFDSWNMHFKTPVRFCDITDIVHRAVIDAINLETKQDEFVAEAWVLTLGKEPEDSVAMYVFDELLHIYDKEKANWELDNYGNSKELCS